MTPPYFIEVLAANGDVLQRQRIEHLPIHIGRGYGNDFILDDAHTAERHAVVEADDNGHLVLHDLGTHNGVIHLGKRQLSVPLSGTTVVRLGHTRLRVRDANFPVPPEVADTTMHAWEGGAPALAGLALIALFIGAEAALVDAETQSFQTIRYLLVIASGLAGGLVWSGLWALANRLFGGHARMGRHLFILGSGLVMAGAWRVLSNVLAYAWSLEWLTRYGNLVTLAIVCGVIFFHMRTIKPRNPKTLMKGCMVLMALGSGLILASNMQNSGRLADELYMSVLLPPVVRQSPDHPVSDFMAEAAKLKTQADAARARAGKSEPDDDDQD
ncbi:FHA domain-containing protein [Pseudoduganella aquatica]|uniref:FHA domain-containing protein n=1 Tax=Pseudoduganella aquatica TaxID=2660641 RepID=A0A7X4HAB8_9BURK|nr:FHA domain-containing protein [Pseudoduganella aquatica]MYN07566.1 FHA domain-containing protein [Pseudoduganella aquatica]